MSSATSRPPRHREPFVTASIAAIFLLLILFIAYPLARVLLSSVLHDGRLTLDTYRQLAAGNALAVPLRNSLLLGAAVAVTATTVAYVAAFALAMTDMPLRRTFRFIATLPMIAPPFMIALAAIMLLGRNGVLTRLLIVPLLGSEAAPDIYGFWGLLLVQTLTYFPTGLLLLLATFAAIDPSLEEAAQSQGAPPRAVFRDVLLPLSLPGVLSSLLLIFIESLADFGNPLLLGGDFRVLSVAAFLRITGEFDTAGGAALASLLLAPALLAWLAHRHLIARLAVVTLSARAAPRRRLPTAPVARVAAASACACIACSVLLFFGAVAYGSLVEVWGVTTALTFDNYAQALRGARGALSDSLLLAALATPPTALLGLAIAWLLVRRSFAGRSTMQLLAMLGFAVPGTVAGIGFVLAFNSPPLALAGTAAIIVLLFLARSTPVALEAAASAIRQIDPAIEEGSASLGARPATTLRRVVLPLVAPAFFTGLAHTFVRSLTAISAVIFVVSARWQLLTVSILGFVENSDLSRAAALCMILVAIVSLVLLLLQTALLRWGVDS